MDARSIYRGTFAALERAMDLRSLKHRFNAANIANIDTPNYKAVDLDFATAMRRAEDSQRLEVHRTQASHLGGSDTAAQAIRPAVVTLSAGASRGDGNTVDLDREMSDMTKNHLMYNALSRVIAKKFTLLKSVIQGGR